METMTSIGNSDLEISIVVQNIFEECDVNGDGMVRVSELIEYIAPYMTENESQLENIRTLLDPRNIDRKVTSEEFLRSMNLWVDKYNQHESLRDLNQTSSSSNSALNISSTPEANSAANASDDIDKSALEDQIHQLTYENKNIYHQLAMVKAQLLNQEEQIESLQTEKANLLKKFNHERELNESLVMQNDSFDENSELNLAKQKQIDKLEKELGQSCKSIAELKKRIDSYEHQNKKYEEKLVAMHEKLAKYRYEVGDLTTAIQLKNDQIKYFEETKEVMLLKIKDLELKLVNTIEKNKCLVIEKNKMSNTLQEVMKKRNKRNSAAKAACKDETTQTTQTPPPNSTSPVPFTSPIKTTKFKFFNIDSPVAKRCLQQQIESAGEDRIRDTQDSESQTDSPISPALNQSLPCLYCVERSGERSASGKGEEMNLSVSGTEEELLQLQIVAMTQNKRKSLMDEMVEYQESMKLTCETCQELCAKIEASKVENEAFQKSLSDCKELLESNNSLEARNKLLSIENVELKSALQQRDADLQVKSDQEAFAQRSLAAEVAKVSELNASHTSLQQVYMQAKMEVNTLKQDVHILNDEKRLHKATISELRERLEGEQLQMQKVQEENNRAHAEHVKEIKLYSKEWERNKDDIDAWKKKCDESGNFAELLKSENVELAQISKESREKLDMIQVELKSLTDLIDNAIGEPIDVQLKLAELINNNNSYIILKGKYEDVVKQAAEKGWKTAIPNKMPHDRAQLKIEKLIEKKEYLEEVVHLNNIKIGGLKADIQRLEVSLKLLNDEKDHLTDKCDDYETEMNSTRRDYEQLSKSVEAFVDNMLKMRLKMIDLVDQWNIDPKIIQSIKSDHVELCLKKVGIGDRSGFFEALQGAGRSMDAIVALVEIISRQERVPHPIKDRALELSRPISPDSPNLEEVLQQPFLQSDDELEMNSDATLIEDPLASIASFYLDFNLEQSLESDNFQEKDRDVALQELVLTMMIDYYGNRQRLKNQLNAIRINVEQLSTELRSLFIANNIRHKNEIMTNISKSMYTLFEAIESYGALKEEVKMSNKVNMLMSHITHLHEENETLKSAKHAQKCASCDDKQVANQLVLYSTRPSRQGLKSFVENIMLQPICYCLLVIGLGFLLLLISPNAIILFGSQSGLPFCWANFWESLEVLFTPALPSTPI